MQGSFQVSTQQPINYTIEEVEGLLDPANKASVHRHCFHATTPASYVPSRRGADSGGDGPGACDKGKHSVTVRFRSVWVCTGGMSFWAPIVRV